MDGYEHSECGGVTSEERSDFSHTARNETRHPPHNLTTRETISD